MAIPVFQEAYVNSQTPWEIVLRYGVDQLDDTSVPTGSDFTVSGGRTVTNVQVYSIAPDSIKSYVILTLNSTLRTNWIAYNESVTVSYTAGVNPLGNISGNCANLTTEAVTNSVNDPTQIVEQISVHPKNPRVWRVFLNRPCETTVGAWTFYIGGVPCTGASLTGFGTGSLFFQVTESVAFGDVLTYDFDTGGGYCTAVQNKFTVTG